MIVVTSVRDVFFSNVINYYFIIIIFKSQKQSLKTGKYPSVMALWNWDSPQSFYSFLWEIQNRIVSKSKSSYVRCLHWSLVVFLFLCLNYKRQEKF